MSPSASVKRPRSRIATYNEGPLHAGLKEWYREAGDRVEVPVDGRQIDLVRGDLLIEIQTWSLGALRRKVKALLSEHQVRVVHSIPVEKYVVRVDKGGDVLGKRRSPKRGKLADAFEELVRLPRLFPHPNFSCELLLTVEEEVRRHEPGRARRRKGWVIVERRLVDVLERRLLQTPADLRGLLPNGLPSPFSTADLAAALGRPRQLAQKMAYALRESGAIRPAGKRGNARLYEASPRAGAAPT